MKVKKNLSLEENLLKAAIKRSNSLGFNFSAYVTYLINKDLNNIDNSIIANNNISNNIKEETVKLDKNVSKAIDDILGI